MLAAVRQRTWRGHLKHENFHTQITLNVYSSHSKVCIAVCCRSCLFAVREHMQHWKSYKTNIIFFLSNFDLPFLTLRVNVMVWRNTLMYFLYRNISLLHRRSILLHKLWRTFYSFWHSHSIFFSPEAKQMSNITPKQQIKMFRNHLNTQSYLYVLAKAGEFIPFDSLIREGNSRENPLFICFYLVKINFCQ